MSDREPLCETLRRIQERPGGHERHDRPEEQRRMRALTDEQMSEWANQFVVHLWKHGALDAKCGGRGWTLRADVFIARVRLGKKFCGRCLLAWMREELDRMEVDVEK